MEEGMKCERCGRTFEMRYVFLLHKHLAHDKRPVASQESRETEKGEK